MSKSVGDRQETFTVVTEVKETSEAHYSSSSEHDPEEQKRVLKIKTPWLGISALIGVVILAIGQYLVLNFANGKSNSQWPATISPNVCLSMINNVSTLFLTFSIGHGIAIAWWRKAMGETSIAKLQKSWSFSTSSLSILRGISHFNVIALSALMAKVAVIDGILFQRAIDTETMISWNATSKNVTAWTRTAFPVTGSIVASKNMTVVQTDYDYSWAVMNWLSTGDGVNSRDYIEGCKGVGCVYGLKGIGFAVDCRFTNVTDNFVNSVKLSGSGKKTIFSAHWDWHFSDDPNGGNYSSLMLKLTKPAIDNDLACPTVFTVTQCEFRPAIVNYTVAYTNVASDAISKPSRTRRTVVGGDPDPPQLGSMGSRLSYSCMSPAGAWIPPEEEDEGCSYEYSPTNRQILGVEVMEVLTLDEGRRTANDSKLAGIFNSLRDQFTADAELYYDAGRWSVAQTGALAPIAEGPTPIDPSFCNYTYYDQTSMILQRLNTLMLQTSVYDYEFSQPDSSESLNLRADQFYRDVYYTIDFTFGYVAISLTVLVVLCVLPSYWQFWVLGREVTLGPLEIANAFRGPMFVEEQIGHHDFEKIMKAVGHKKLKYHHATQPGQQPGFHIVS